jgi:hypothetical protein
VWRWETAARRKGSIFKGRRMSMKLKRIVASLVAFGLSGPVLATQPYYGDTSYLLDVMRAQVNKIDLVLDQNQPGGFDQPCGWTCRVNLSGWMNTDAYIANRPPDFLNTINVGQAETNGRASDLILNNANFFVDARVNNWVTANASIVYTSLSPIPGAIGSYGIVNTLFIYRPIPSGSVLTRNIDTAYATIGNFRDDSQIYFRVGKEYVPFGQYDPYAFVQSENFTQLMTETNAPAAQFGFILPFGLYGSAYVFSGNPTLSNVGATRRIQNGGLDLGYAYYACDKKVNLDAGYIGNISDVNFLASDYTNSAIALSAFPGIPDEKVPAYDVNATIQFGPFDANAHYVATTRELIDPKLLGIPFLLQTLGRPKVWGVEAGYTFPVSAHQSRLAIGYQRSTHLASLLPQQRIYADYLVNLAKWFDLGFAVFHDKDYPFGEGAVMNNFGTPIVIQAGATGNKSTVGQLRASIKFA